MLNVINKLKNGKHFKKAIIGTSILIICITMCLLLIPDKSIGKTDNNIGEINNEEEPLLIILPEEEIDINEIEEISEEDLENLQIDKEQIKKEPNLPTYYIKVNYGANVVTIYTKDSNNEYTIPTKAMICSAGTATPKSGVYKMNGKYRWLALFGGVYGQYSSRIVGHILFHSVPYLEKNNNGSIEYWEYDKLGQFASAGCIRLTVIDAMWIYNNCASGTMVEFYTSDDPGPLGKPSAPKISNAPDHIRGWDPTDPNENNPWKTYITNSVEENNVQNHVENTVIGEVIENPVVPENNNSNNNASQNEVTEGNNNSNNEAETGGNEIGDNNTINNNNTEENNEQNTENDIDNTLED